MEQIIFNVIILIFSVVIHEVAHGYVAEYLGDPTARNEGRLTLNPIKHLDPFGSVILPLILALLPGGIIFGWAKPVPYNPYNLKDPKKGGGLIAAAGPISNMLLAIVFSVLFRLSVSEAGIALGLGIAAKLFSVIVFINIMLAIFNLVPLPPLDGSKVLFALLPRQAAHIQTLLEQYGLFVFLLFIFVGGGVIGPIMMWLYRLFLGM